MSKREAKQRFSAPCDPLEADDIRIVGVRRLAAAVILSALDDLSARDDERRKSAHRFFSDRESYLAYWCSMVGLDPEDARAKATEAMRGRGAGRPKSERRSTGLRTPKSRATTVRQRGRGRVTSR